MISSVLVAAGKSERFGGTVPKVFSRLCDKPLISYSLEAFQRAPLIKEIILVVSDDRINDRLVRHLKELFPRISSIVAGGSCREESVLRGLRACSDCAHWVLIHDGARPLVSQRLIARVARAAMKYGSGVPVLPVNESLRKMRGQFLCAELPRQGVCTVQTPQGFHLSLLKEKMEKYEKNLEDFTDESGIFLRAGISVRTVKGESSNIKVTTKADMDLCRALQSDFSSEEGLE
ncbi:MAG: 2-C-methyl-D-erythritol 4-phosphate cytidylyltransferase [Candidatus Ratteibacteria bacterium]